jgi:hypothetical protein
METPGHGLAGRRDVVLAKFKPPELRALRLAKGTLDEDGFYVKTLISGTMAAVFSTPSHCFRRREHRDSDNILNACYADFSSSFLILDLLSCLSYAPGSTPSLALCCIRPSNKDAMLT